MPDRFKNLTNEVLHTKDDIHVETCAFCAKRFLTMYDLAICPECYRLECETAEVLLRRERLL